MNLLIFISNCKDKNGKETEFEKKKTENTKSFSVD